MEIDESRLRTAVCDAYSNAAQAPEDDHPFPVGKEFARSVGYPEELLDSLPSVATTAFAGVSNVAVFANIAVGATVLDIGCGSGLDSLVATRRTGPTGVVFGVDFSETMLDRATGAAKASGLRNVWFSRASAESLPLADASVDVALVNGIFNLNPWRTAIFGELGRVVKPGGAVYTAELILRDPLPEAEQRDASNWFA